jgi:hypothetical protein
MKKHMLLAICFLFLASSAYGDHAGGPDQSSVPGHWRVDRIDLGTGEKQGRLVPDGSMTLRIEKDGAAGVIVLGGTFIKGHLKWEASGEFQFTFADDKQPSVAGTWTAGEGRMILSFRWQRVPVSILFHRHSLGTPTPAGFTEVRIESDPKGWAYAHKTVKPDGSITGGHLSGGPDAPRVHETKSEVTPQDMATLKTLVVEARKEAPKEQAKPMDQKSGDLFHSVPLNDTYLPSPP